MVLILQIATLCAMVILAHRLEALRRRIDTLDPRLRGFVEPWAVSGAEEAIRSKGTPGHDTTRDVPIPPSDRGGTSRDRAPILEQAGPAVRAARNTARAAAQTEPARGAGAGGQTAGLRVVPSRPRVDLELRFGRRWAALLGGGLVAFGLVLLLRHSFEQGYVSPPVRLCGAALLSLALCAAAEVFRRRGTFTIAASGLARHAADIPSVLLGTGLGGLFATTYAAHAVYGYLDATPAVAAMAVAALSGIAASLAYGPALGVLGYMAAQSVPLLVGGGWGSPVAVHVALVGAAGYAAAHVGGWRRLENAAGAVLLLWSSLLYGEPSLAITAVPASAAAFTITVLRLRPRAAWADWRPNRGACIALLLMAGQGLLLATSPGGVAPSPVGGIAAALGFAVLLAAFGFAATATRARPAAPALAAAVVGALALPAFRIAGGPWFDAADPLGPGAVGAVLDAVPVSAAALAIAAGALHRGSRRSPLTGLVGAASAAGVLAGVDLVLHLAGGMDSRALAATAATQGAAMIAAARPRRGAIPPARQFAAAAAGSAGIGLLGFALVASGFGSGPRTTLVVALASGGAAILAVLWASSLFATVAGIAAVPVLVGSGLGIARSVLQVGGGGATLWPFLADTLLPGLILAGSAALLHNRVGMAAVREADQCWLRLIGVRSPAPQAGQAISLALAGTAAAGLLLAALVGVVRFAAYGDALAPLSAPADIGLACTFALSAALAATRLQRAVPSPMLRSAAGGSALAAVPLTAAALLANPFVTGVPVGALPVVNLLVIAYLLPALAAWRLARASSGPDASAPAGSRSAAAAVAITGTLAYATFAVAQAFQGSVLSTGRISEAELWCYTAVWLLTAAAVMACGLRARAKGLRIAALGILAATAGKVAFVDLAHLEGSARAASVLALGTVLLGVGMVYQRLFAAGERG